MIVIKGDTLEGGGQIIRTSVALSAITGKSVKITNIRANRPNPGLQNQHLESIKAVGVLCNAKVEGLKLDSTEITFIPGKITAKEINISIPTAGSIGLVLQALLPAAFHTNKEITMNIKGGATFGKWAPPLPFVEYVLLPLLEQIGYEAKIEIKKHGFYPKGGADVSIKCSTHHGDGLLNKANSHIPISLSEEVNFTKCLVHVYSFASKSLENAKVAERQSEKAVEILKKEEFNIAVKNIYVETDNPGSGIVCFTKNNLSTIGADALGERDKKAEEVGKEAALKLLEELKTKAPVDSHTADQLIPYLAMNGGSILVSKITEHTKTNIWVCEQFLDKKFTVKGNLISFE